MRDFLFTLSMIFVLTACTSDVELSADSKWYAFTPTNDYSQRSLIGLEEWNSEPAGAHGRILSEGDRLLYRGEEVKLWGINNTYGDCAPPRALADNRAAFYRKFGINAMRLHKYADRPAPMGIQSKDSFVEVDSASLDRMDYFVSVLKENGIYTKLSPTFGVKFGPGDMDRVPFHAEIGQFDENSDRLRATYGSIYLSKEIQDLQIEQTTRLLKHKNPYTGLTYAKDPAIFCVELFNEDAVLWYGANWSLQRYPTLRKRTARAFSKWLLNKYKSEAEWKAAWGEKAILSEVGELESHQLNTIISIDKVKGPALLPESLLSGSTLPWYYPWAMDNVLGADSDFPELKQRLLDAAAFLIGKQNEFYNRFITEIRQTGYTGEIVASNWQAGSTLGHLLNLHSDYQAGIVDRHNYFGGKIRAFRDLGSFADASMLARPGIGTLSAGLQQVEGRPFMLSEWIHVQPNEWYAEGPAILAAYGWGLNGWDVSYMFQNRDDGGFSDRLGKHAWDVSNPAVMGLFPAISRQVRRMDVQESKITHHLHAHIPSLLEGKLGFMGTMIQEHDVKTFSTDKVPAATLATQRVAVKFGEEYQATKLPDLAPYREDGTLVSSTGELSWTAAPDSLTKGGYITVNTSATKAFIGFSTGSEVDLGDGYRIRPGKGFSVIYLCAKGEHETLETAKEIIVTAMARARNSGMKLNEEENELLEAGSSPILLEPVKAIVHVPFNGKLQILDQDGGRILQTRDFRRAFGIDGATDKTPFYLLEK